MIRRLKFNFFKIWKSFQLLLIKWIQLFESLLNFLSILSLFEKRIRISTQIMALITFHFKSKHPPNFIPILYGSLPELGGGKPENGIQMEPTENLDDSNISSYNCVLEVYFSKKTIELQNNFIHRDWYSYSIQPPFGLTFKETAPHRHFPDFFYQAINSNENDDFFSRHSNTFSLYDTENIINPVSDFLLVRFKLNKHVEFGTEIFISGNCEELGNWDINNSKQLAYANDGQSEYWTADIKFPLISKSQNSLNEDFEHQTKKKAKNSKSSFLNSFRREIEYKYFLSSSENDIRWEPEAKHKLLIGLDPTISSSPSYIEVNDTYRYTDNVINVFSRSAFVNVINKRGSQLTPSSNPELHIHQNNVKPGHVLLTFIVNCPYIKKRQNLIIVGNSPELGEWCPLRALKMSDSKFPYWTASILVKRQNSKFNYKYVIEDTKFIQEDEHSTNRFIWENRGDRICTGVTHDCIDCDFPASITMNDWYVSPHIQKLFKGVTINVPLFSLKTDNSCGIGSYSDLKFVVDICRATGSSMIQLMPINDTMKVPLSAVLGNSSNGSSSIPNSGSMGNFRATTSKSPFSHSSKGQYQNLQIGKHGYSSRGSLHQSSSMSFNDFSDDDHNSTSKSEFDIWSCSNPYNIVSVFALNPIYVNLQDILNEEIQITSKSKKKNINTPYSSLLFKPDKDDNDQEYDYKSSVFSEIQNEIIAHRCMLERNSQIDYPAVLRFKLSILKKIFVKIVETRPEKFDLENDEDYNKFIKENEGWLKPYSVFCILRDKYNTCDFHKWTEPLQHYSESSAKNNEGNITSQSDIDDLYQTYSGTELSFIYWVQYICDKQMKSSKEYASAYSIALKVEMPYYIPFDSSDCWAFRDLFDFDNFAGSPPDMRCIEGQNYNVPILRDWTSQKRKKAPSLIDQNQNKYSQNTPDVIAMQHEVQRKRERLINCGSFKSSQSLSHYKNYYPSQNPDKTSKQETNVKRNDNNFPLAENWWSMRMKRMSNLFDAAEIDNTLNLFRNWVIPKDSFRAVTGYFSPSNPLSKQELDEQIGFNTMISHNMPPKESTISINQITIERLTKPYVRYQMIRKKFDDETPHVISEFFTPRNVNQQNDFYDFQERCNTESKINDILYQTVFDEGRRDYYRTALFQLLSNVILIIDRNSQPDDYQFNNKYHIRAELTIEHVEGLNGNGNNQKSSNYNYHSFEQKNSFFDSSNKYNHNVMNCTPRTTFSTHESRVFPSSSWLDLEPEYRQKLLIMCNDYFYGDRNKQIWLDEAKPKLKLINEACPMLVFSNDFNEISASFEKELENHQVIKYNVPRYPRNHPNLFQVEQLNGTEDNSMNNGLSFMKCEYFDYLSQCVPTPSTEDCLRSWWEKNRASTIQFWQNEILDQMNAKNANKKEENTEMNNRNGARLQSGDQSKKDNQKKSSVDNDCLSEGYFFLSPNNAPQIPPEFLEPWVQEVVISKYLSCRSMWCTFMLQDLVSMFDRYRRQYPNDECVHRPDQGIKWQHRYPFKLEEILNDGEFIGKLRYLLDQFERL